MTTLQLREPSLEDGKAFIDAMNRSSSLHQRWVNPAKSLADYNQYLQQNKQANQNANLLIANQNDIVGVFNLSEIVRGCFQNAYLGFYAVSGFEGRGLMSQGLKLLLHKAFNKLELHRIEANIQPNNLTSIHLVKANGFRHEGFSPRYLFIDNAWRDHERFAITKEDVKS